MTSKFTEADYNSDMGMSTRVFGPIQWSFFHMISFNYPVHPTEDDKEHYHQYVLSLQYVLPCLSCRNNYKKNLKAANYSKDKLKDRATFSRFVYDLHNQVNNMLGKLNYLTYEAIRDRFELFRAKCVNDTPIIPVHNKELGCVVPLNNVKSQCLINIVPFNDKRDTFNIDKKCIPSSNGKLNGGSKKSKSSRLSKKGSKKSKKSSRKTSKKGSKGISRRRS